MTLNNEIKEYWEGEAGVYSQGIQEELNGSQRQAWVIFSLPLLGNSLIQQLYNTADLT